MTLDPLLCPPGIVVDSFGDREMKIREAKQPVYTSFGDMTRGDVFRLGYGAPLLLKKSDNYAVELHSGLEFSVGIHREVIPTSGTFVEDGAEGVSQESSVLADLELLLAVGSVEIQKQGQYYAIVAGYKNACMGAGATSPADAIRGAIRKLGLEVPPCESK